MSRCDNLKYWKKITFKKSQLESNVLIDTLPHKLENKIKWGLMIIIITQRSKYHLSSAHVL